ncbi:MAG: M13 family metallopeptidase [Elusimicrobia bacterium]|nr:M13 family metallopeptidase [Elusimicrobiota bacterium]
MSKYILALLLLCPAASYAAGDKTPGFDPKALDRQMDPFSDFYRFACGGWLDANPVPADQSSWGRFRELAERNRQTLRNILETASADNPGRNALDRQIGDFYAACMDETGIDKRGTQPLVETLNRIDSMTDAKQLPGELAKLFSSGEQLLFGFGPGQDFKDTTKMIGQLDQGGLGLPERDYYLKTDQQSELLRRQYADHIAATFALLGYDAQKSSDAAQDILAFETELAKASQDMVSRRVPENLDHKMSIPDLAKLAPAIDWKDFFRQIGAPKMKEVNVISPDFFKRVSELLKATPLQTWKRYLTWHYVDSRANLLPKAFVDENFAFYGKTLSGAKELRPRWKRCTDMVNGALGEALGQRYVEQTFGGNAKTRVLDMVHDLEAALGKDIAAIDWMTPDTRKRAQEKLAAIENKIGYPDKWRDYSPVRISRADAMGNAENAQIFEQRRQFAQIGKPVDRQEWHMTPPTVNAYYDPQMNNINFPAGILQPPFFDNDMDDAVNFGGIGAVIGHELTHGFDDQGRKYDAKGNLNDWWTPQDASEYDKRSACLVNQYGNYRADTDTTLNGKLTLGENTADNGGLRLALMALDSKEQAAPTPKRDGFTPRQRLFLAWGQIWCTNYTPQAARLQALTDPHSLAKYRVNGVLVNMPEFADAFSCQKSQPMISESPCRVW